eukprot:365916-Chlamydomonas_euryale.AAC.3
MTAPQFRAWAPSAGAIQGELCKSGRAPGVGDSSAVGAPGRAPGVRDGSSKWSSRSGRAPGVGASACRPQPAQKLSLALAGLGLSLHHRSVVKAGRSELAPDVVAALERKLVVARIDARPQRHGVVAEVDAQLEADASAGRKRHLRTRRYGGASAVPLRAVTSSKHKAWGCVPACRRRCRRRVSFSRNRALLSMDAHTHLCKRGSHALRGPSGQGHALLPAGQHHDRVLTHLSNDGRQQNPSGKGRRHAEALQNWQQALALTSEGVGDMQ